MKILMTGGTGKAVNLDRWIAIYVRRASAIPASTRAQCRFFTNLFGRRGCLSAPIARAVLICFSNSVALFVGLDGSLWISYLRFTRPKNWSWLIPLRSAN